MRPPVRIDANETMAELRRSLGALRALHHRVRGPRVCRGDRVGRRRRRG